MTQDMLMQFGWWAEVQWYFNSDIGLHWSRGGIIPTQDDFFL